MPTEIFNERLLYPSYEIIGGEKIMAPAPNLTHSNIIGRLYLFIGNYLMANKSGYVYSDNVDVHFSDGTLFKPDLCVVLKSNEKILAGQQNIFGAPDMVVEVLSKSTKKRDVTIKKDTYELNGVKEYWIVDPYMEIVDVYLLKDGKYYLDGEYILYNEDEWEMLTDEQRAENKTEITLATFPDLTIKLSDIFYDRKWR